MKSMVRRFAALGLVSAMVVPALLGGAQVGAVAKPKPKFVNLKNVPKPKITGKEIIAGLEEFVEKYPLRQSVLSDTPVGNNIGAAEFLADEAKSFGYDTRIITYEGEGQGGNDVRVVEAVKKGTTKPNEWITFVAHYDTIASAGVTLQGAYDDGSGTNIMRYFAKAFSKIKTKRSIAIIWFDGEETGLTGSNLYTQELPAGVKFHAVMGFDMVGIGYPARYCICIYHGALDGALAAPIIDYVNKDFLKFPMGDGGPSAAEKWPIGTEGHICNCGQNIRNSDESNFASKGIFTMRWTGMRTASDYPGYHHPWDTIPFMEMVAGGRDLLEKGTENTFKSAYYTTFVLDALP